VVSIRVEGGVDAQEIGRSCTGSIDHALGEPRREASAFRLTAADPADCR